MLTLAARRAAAGILTLFLLSVAVFFAAQLLPGNIGRAILGPLADPASVAALNHQLGADRPPLTIYAAWTWHFLHGDMGTSYALRTPVAPLVLQALGRSMILAVLTFIIAVPVAIAAGIVAALRAGTFADRTIMLAGLALTTVPEFVSGIILILVFGVWLRWLPISAHTRPGTGALEQLRHLILPALPLALVLFGYITRIARAGTWQVLQEDYTRTAILKGLPARTVLLRHVLRNAMLPTITVVATQFGYMVGGLVVVETLFRYQGIGSLILLAAQQKDFPMLQAGVLIVGTIFVLATLCADLLTTWLDPRRRNES
jgi:peptide/nickel transport system permease protein